VRVASSNERPDFERDQIDVALQFAAAGTEAPKGEYLFKCETFPACAPALARNRTRPLRTPADLAHHVRLDFETLRAGRWFSEWDYWFDATGTPPVSAARTLRFSQLEQLVPAAIAGGGVAMGVMPHFTRFLRDGRLCAPFGRTGFAHRGDFYLVVRRDAVGDEAVEAFSEWLRNEARQDGALPLASPRTVAPSRKRQTRR
jgi:LysR family glycine cleavage system transcriptional activator